MPNNVEIIVAVAENNAIGNRGDLIAHIREDLRRFRDLTTGNTVIMGRKTYESLPMRPLPDRHNIIITRNPDYDAPGAQTASSLEDALAKAIPGTRIFIIGGAQIYRQALPLASTLHITRLHIKPAEADTFFPRTDPGNWEITQQSPVVTDPRTEIPYNFITLSRK